MHREVDAVNDLSFLVRQERHRALLAALDQLVTIMAASQNHCDTMRESAIRGDERMFWRQQLADLLRQHREGR